MVIPKISVCIPVYNASCYIKRCLYSLFENTLAPECEFIIVDDCCTDNSLAIANQVLENFPKIRQNVFFFSHDTNRGSAASRNTALEHALSDFILYVDADDWVEKNYLEKMYAEISQKNADVVICAYFEEYNNGEKKKTKTVVPIAKKKTKDEIYADFISDRIQGYCWNKIIRKSLFTERSIRFMEGIDLWEDVLILSKIMFYAQSIYFVEEPIYHYEKRTVASISNSMSVQKYGQMLDAMQLIRQFLLENNIWDKFNDSFLCRCVTAKIIVIRKLPKKLRPYTTLFTDEEKSFIMKRFSNKKLRLVGLLIIKKHYGLANCSYFLSRFVLR